MSGNYELSDRKVFCSHPHSDEERADAQVPCFSGFGQEDCRWSHYGYLHYDDGAGCYGEHSELVRSRLPLTGAGGTA